MLNRESLDAFVFINFKQAIGFGHVAWGFALDAERYFFGSTDHLLRTPMWHLPALLSYSRVAPGGDVDFWCGQGSLNEMLEMMSSGPHIRYHSYKRLSVSNANPEQARDYAFKLRERGWCIVDNNCVHQTARLLQVFGVNPDVLNAGSILPVDKSLRVPVQWFGALEAEEVVLRKIQTSNRAIAVSVREK